jgi:hypothetical protein
MFHLPNYYCFVRLNNVIVLFKHFLYINFLQKNEFFTVDGKIDKVTIDTDIFKYQNCQTVTC